MLSISLKPLKTKLMEQNSKDFCYRITHIQNLECILKNGIVCKNHARACGNYINIGHQEIIDVRSTTAVKINTIDNISYGMIGDYIPCYFTPKSTMLYNILTGYYHPKVQKRKCEEILVMRFKISTLANLPNLFFFTDGQANDYATKHYNSLADIQYIDWESIHKNNFSKKDDEDRARRYQAEFLVKDEIPISCIEGFYVYNQNAKEAVQNILAQNEVNIKVEINRNYYFSV